MVRWEPGTAERLQAAALELFSAHGYEQTTAADVAASVGLTERTFFRHFADKREVLFAGQQQFAAGFLDGAAAAPPGAVPLEVVAAALRAGAEFFPAERRPHSRQRQSVIDANPALAEREQHKLASLAASVAVLLRARGVAEPAATLAAETGMTVFRVAFAEWLRDGETRSMAEICADVMDQLACLAAAASSPARSDITHES